MYDKGFITIGGEEFLSLYGIMIAIGIVACIFVLHFLGKKLGLKKKLIDNVETIAYVAILIGFLFAALFQGFYNFLDGDKFSISGGITFIGGLIGGVIGFIVVYLIFKNKINGTITDILPIAPSCIVIAHAFGRIGCFFAGCCGGVQTNSIFGIQFPGDTYKTYPTQLFEALFLFALFGILFYLTWKKDFKYSFVIYLATYGVWRFLLEFLRGDERGTFVGNISPSQFWSIAMVALTVPVYFLLKYLYGKRAKEIADEDMISLEE